MDAVLYWKIDSYKPKTEKALVTTPNLVFLKCFNYTLATALMYNTWPHSQWMRVVHAIGMFCCVASFVMNTVVLLLLKRERPKTTFTPFSIIATSLSPLYVIPIDVITMFTRPGGPIIIGVALGFYACTYLATGGYLLSWFEDFLLLDVWAFVLFFVYRKVGWFALNMREQDEIVRFFKTTCYDFIEHAPKAELLYSATTGMCGIIAINLGKIAALCLFRYLGAVAHLQALYFSGLVGFYILAFKFDFNAWFITYWFLRHHKFEHLSAKQFLCKHCEHHDAVPVASIGSADTGFQEGFHRSIAPWQYTNTFLFGPNWIQYFAAMGDEWSHNYCPTAKYSSILQFKHVHVDHHFARTVPLGFHYETEVEMHDFKYDSALWDNIASFMPGVTLPEHEDWRELRAAAEAGMFSWEGGPGSDENPKPPSDKKKEE